MSRTCEIEGCERRHLARGWCQLHYKRWKTYGDPLAGLVRLSPDGRCTIEGCEQEHQARGWCKNHYVRWQRHGDPLGGADRPSRRRATQGCSVEGCDRPVHRRGWCRRHFGRWERHGDPLAGRRPAYAIGTTCKVDACDDLVASRELCAKHLQRLTRRGSLDDPQRVQDGDEYIDRHGYVRVKQTDHPMANSKGYLFMHRYVMAEHLGRELQSDESVHHRNGDKQDNRIENLELWVGVGRQPKGQRPADLVPWAREILERYGADVDAGKL